MLFEVLQKRLLGSLRVRVQNGEVTERGLARATGISQPHIHNVLKGARILSPEMADLILLRLGISLLDLLHEDEVMSHRGRSGNGERYQAVPVLDGPIGPNCPMPSLTRKGESYPIHQAQTLALVQPVVAQLAADPEMEPLVREDDLVLLDQAGISRAYPTPDKHYVVLTPRGALIRRLRRSRHNLYLVTEVGADDPDRWEAIPLIHQQILDVVRARVIWLTLELRQPLS